MFFSFFVFLQKHNKVLQMSYFFVFQLEQTKIFRVEE